MQVDEAPSNAVVLHEDKKYYPDASEVYGEHVETLVQEEDAQPITQPLVEPVRVREFALQEADLPTTRYDKKFLVDLLQFPDMVRNVAVVGHLHHGKTSLLDMLVEDTHQMDVDVDRRLGYTDALKLERDRGISLKTAAISLVLPDTKGKSHAVHFLDTPGHPNFSDEVTASLRLVDGVVLVVDVVEGVMSQTEAVVKYCVRENLPIVLVVNKLDRLVLELKLPPTDAYFKIRQTIGEVNAVVSSVSKDPARRLSPERGNVAFASTAHRYVFTLRSFAQLYALNTPIDEAKFAQRLWGDIYYSPASRNFSRTPTRGAADGGSTRSFLTFILVPLYKLYTSVLSSDTASLKATLGSMGIYLPPASYKADVRPLLRLVLSQFFSTGPVGLGDLVAQLPSAREGAPQKVERYFDGALAPRLAAGMAACDARARVVVHVTKLLPSVDGRTLRALGRVMSGTVMVGQAVRVLGPSFSPDDDEDMMAATVDGVFLDATRYVLPVEGVPAGSLVLLSGVDESIVKAATIVGPPSSPSSSSPAAQASTSTSASTNNQQGGEDEDEEMAIFRPVRHMNEAVLKVAVEPLVPSDLPKLLAGLRAVSKTYPLAEVRVEESGEHVLLGTGELYLDSIMSDLRTIWAEVEIKVSDPIVRFAETVIETSMVQCTATTPNGKNVLTLVAEPLEKGLAEAIEAGDVDMRLPPRKLARLLSEQYDWDALAARSVWAFGPDQNGPNVLVDDTLPGEVDKSLLYAVKQAITQGFQWGTREGPLADEPMRNVKFRILGAALADNPLQRGGGQIIPTARRACYAAFLLAQPRLLEPVLAVEVQAPPESVGDIYAALSRRRGHVVRDAPKPGTPLVTVHALLPAIDSAGFETDVRTLTQGQAFPLQAFSHWQVVPGDPLDRDIVLRPLEPAPPLGLARDFTLKTRRRKGLADHVTAGAYLDAEMVHALEDAGVQL